MPSYVLRVAPDDPTYVLWSTVVEAPIFMGDEAEMRTYLERFEQRCKEPCCYQKQVLDRLDRANRAGTSSLGGFYGYDDPGMIVEQTGVLPRSALGAFARAFLLEGDDDFMSYLQPFDDDEANAVPEASAQ